jgi:hypothetical protein
MKKVLLSGTMAMLACIFLAANVLADTPIKPANPFEDTEGMSAPAAGPLASRPDRAMLGATINVPGDYGTIQAAIDAAVSGDVIVVAAGTYGEAITIDNKTLTIQGVGVGISIITGTTAVTQYIVKITNGAVVDFSGFTVDGTGKNIQYGIYATASTDGNIHDNEIKNVSYPGAAGLAVRRQDSQIDVMDNDVYGFGRIGIYTRDDGILNTDGGVISGNTVTGLGGSDPARLSYGISVYSGNPTIDDNEISGCVSGSGVTAWASSAIDVWTGSTSALTNNYIHDSDYGIISNSASPVMSGNTFSGIAEDEVRLDYFVKGNPTPHWAEYYNTIQAAIDAIPSTTYPCIVWVAIYSGTGTYVEQVEVAKNCHIYGAGAGSVIIQSPATLTKGWTTSTTNKPVVYIHDADDVLLGDLTVDGLGLGNANYRFIGVGFRNAGGTVWNCEVLSIKDTPFSGAQHGVAIYAYNDDTVARSITVEDCTISGFQKNGMALIGTATTPLAVNVTGNTVTGAGATGVTAQNGIQVQYATGAVANNTVSGIGYSGTGWVACSFLQFYGDVDFTGNTVTDAQVGVYNWDGSGDITGNDITVSLIGSYSDGIIAADPPDKLPSPITENESAPAPGTRIATGGTPLDVNITGNTVAFSGATNTGSYGIEAYAGCSAEDLDVAVNSNVVTGFDYGVVFSACTGTGSYPSVFTGLDARDNTITGSTTYGMYSDITYLTVDATGTWWGDQSGPYHPTLNPDGAGNAVTDNILFEPWTGQYAVTVVPPYTLTNCVTPQTVTFRIDQEGTSSDQVRGYNIEFSVDDAVVTAGSFVEGAYLSSVNGTAFYPVDNGGGSYTVSCAILGGTVGATGGGELFSLTLTPVAAGTCDIAISSLLVRDLDNAPLAASATGGSVVIDCTEATMDPIVEAEGGWYNAAPSLSHVGFDDNVNLDVAQYSYDGGAWIDIFSGINAASWDSDPWVLPGFGSLTEGSHEICFRVKDDAGTWSTAEYCWQFYKDTTLPAPPTNFVAMPGHDKTHLSWTNPSGDATFVGVEIRFNGWVDYPEYDDAAPAYPPDHTMGTFVTLAAGTSFDDNPRKPRDIYYYSAFSKDLAGNYSSLGTSAYDRCTSYWLGDIVPNTDPATFDGNVNLSDLAAFSVTFGLPEGHASFDNDCDFGPTDDWSRFGIPLPDDRIDFEDLMIFSMNYQRVLPAGSKQFVAAARAAENLDGLVAFKLLSNNDGSVSIVLTNRAATLKGVHIVVSVEGGTLERVERGSLIAGSSDVFFGLVPGVRNTADISTAALGVDAALEGSGEVARLVIAADDGSAPRVRFTAIDLRDLSNAKTELVAGEEHETPFVPKATALLQNYPNPFNPVTTITIDLTAAGHVRLDVFDVSGRLLATLVNGTKTAGRHAVQWNGKDASGSLVPSGIYFYRMKAEGYEATRKMILVR